MSDSPSLAVKSAVDHPPEEGLSIVDDVRVGDVVALMRVGGRQRRIRWRI